MYLQEQQFQEQQEELQRELQQRSTQQLLEQSYYDNSNSKSVDLDCYRRAYDKPQLITNLNNLNCQSSSNYNTINQSSAKDILYELKQYEQFANNSNPQLGNFNFNNYVTDRHSTSYNGTKYSQNILSYNNSYYRINNINNFNYVKNSASPSSQIAREQYYSKQHDKYLLNDKMDRDETVVECSQLVNSNRDTNGRSNVTIHNFTSNNVTSHTTIPSNHHHVDDEEEQHNVNQPIHRSQHFTQVSRHR